MGHHKTILKQNSYISWNNGSFFHRTQSMCMQNFDINPELHQVSVNKLRIDSRLLPAN